jgi:hypothetical protein
LKLVTGDLGIKDEFIFESIEGNEWGKVFASIGVVSGWGVGEIESQFEAEFSHVGNDAIEEWAGTLKTGVCIDFDEPGLEIAINHKI